MTENNSAEVKVQDIELDDKVEDSKKNADHSPYIIFPNPEKGERRRLGPEPYMPYSSSRILLSAMPNCGKRNLILNIIYHMNPLPTVCHIVHCDPLTVEYDCLGEMGIKVIMYDPSDFPTLKNIEEPEETDSDNSEDSENAAESADENEEKENKKATSPQNTLVIVDECTADQLGKLGSHRLERMVNHICTHRNTTLICSIQSLVNIPPKARRGFNHLVLWKQADKMVNQMSALRASISNDMLEDLFRLCESKYDFIWIDLDESHDSPWRYRLNFYEPITIVRTA